MSGSIVGSPTYMSSGAPARGEYDERSDVYSVGVMLYQMLSGRLPLESSTTRVPLGLRHLVEDPPSLSVIVPSIPGGLRVGRDGDGDGAEAGAAPSAARLAFALGAFLGSESVPPS